MKKLIIIIFRFSKSREEKNSEDETENCVKNLCEILTQNSILGRYT